MRCVVKYIIFVVALLSGVTASAQFTIQHGTDTLGRVSVDNIIPSEMTATKGGYFDPAAYRAELRRLRHERNSVEFNATLQTSLQQYVNWQENNTTALSMLAHIDFRHIYKREKLSWDITANANYGMNYLDNAVFKNRDDIKLTGLMQWKIHNTWSFSGLFTLETQFANGFKSRTDHTLISNFMSPGKITLSPGFTWQPIFFPIIVTISPLGGNVSTMLDRRLSTGVNSVPEGKLMMAKLGPSLNITTDKTWGKEKQYRYRTTFYIFSNLQSSPIVQWTNTFDYRLNRYFSTTATMQLYYDKAAAQGKVQFNYSLMLGLAYKFKNK